MDRIGRGARRFSVEAGQAEEKRAKRLTVGADGEHEFAADRPVLRAADQLDHLRVGRRKIFVLD